LVWCDDPPEGRVISIVAGCLANHDRAHSRNEIKKEDKFMCNRIKKKRRARVKSVTPNL
jgi:hypothetical protein